MNEIQSGHHITLLMLDVVWPSLIPLAKKLPSWMRRGYNVKISNMIRLDSVWRNF